MSTPIPRAADDPPRDAATPVQEPPARAIRLLLAVLVTAVTVTVMNNSMVIVLLPEISRDFSASTAAVSWVVTGFSLAFAVGTPLYGRVADVFGIRWVFCAGLVMFLGGSLLAGLATGLPVLLTARVLQGIGGAAVPALASVTVARMLPDGRRGLAFGLIGTGVGVGQALGPVLGGLVAQVAGWSAPFLGAAALTAPLVVLAARMLPGAGTAARTGWRSIDVPGGLLLGSAAALGLLGVTEGQRTGFGAISSWGAVVLAVVLAVAFTVRIRTASAPFAPPALFANTAFVTAAVVGFLTLFCYLGVLLLIPQLVTSVNGLAVGEVGLVLLPGAAVVATLSAPLGRQSDRVGARLLIATGLGVLLVAVFTLSVVAGGSVLVIGAIMLALGLSLAMVTSPLINAVSAAVPAAHSGVGLGIYQGAFFLGGGTGAAVTGAVLSARSGAGDGAPAWNPLHSGAAAAYSDTLLVVAAVLVVTVVLALRLPGGPSASAARASRTTRPARRRGWRTPPAPRARAGPGARGPRSG